MKRRHCTINEIMRFAEAAETQLNQIVRSCPNPAVLKPLPEQTRRVVLWYQCKMAAVMAAIAVETGVQEEHVAAMMDLKAKLQRIITLFKRKTREYKLV